MTLEIVCVRHAESVGNVAYHAADIEADHSHFTPEFRRVRTRDWELTDRGVTDARRAGRYIRENLATAELFFASDYRRARDTSVLLALSNSWVYTPLIAERERGLMEGLTRRQWEALAAERSWPATEQSVDWRPPNGESAREVVSRVHELFDKVRARGGRAMLLVSHGEVIQCIRFMARGLEFDEYPRWMDQRGDVRNCHIFQFLVSIESRSVREISHHAEDGRWIRQDNGSFPLGELFMSCLT